MNTRAPLVYDTENCGMYVCYVLPSLNWWDRLQCRLGVHKWHRAYHEFLNARPDGSSYWRPVKFT